MANPILDQAATGTSSSTSKLSAVEEALGASTTRISENIKQLESDRKQMQSATDVAVGAIGDIASASQTIQRASDNADLQAQNATIDTFIAQGGHGAQVALSKQLTEQEVQLQGLLEEKLDIADDEHTGIGIIDGIINEFRGYQTDLEIEAAQALRDHTAKQIAAAGAATETFARQNALVKQTINDGTIQANYDKIGAEAALASSKMEIQNIATNADAMLRLTNMDQKNVSNIMQVYRLEGEEENRVIARERQAFAREQMAHTREVWEVELPAAQVNLEASILRLETAKATNPSDIQAAIANNASAVKRYDDALATEETLVDQVQKGQSLSGLTVEDRETVLFGLRNNKSKYIRLQEMGGAPDAVIGLTPYDAQSSLQVVDPTSTAKLTPATRMLSDVSKLQAEKYKTDPKGAPKDEETLKADFNATAKELATAATAEIKMGDGSNPYIAPPMTVLATKASVANSTLYKRVLEPLNMQETNPQRIMDATVAGISAGTITPEEGAAGIEAVFEAAAAHNNTDAGGFRRVGLPNQETYNAQLVREPTDFELLKGTVMSVASPTAVAGLALTAVSEGTAKATGELATKMLDATIKTFTVDLMNEAKVKETLVKMLSSHPDKKDEE